MEYLNKGNMLTNLSSVTSNTLEQVGSKAVIKISTHMRNKSLMKKKEMILFASGYGTGIADQFGMDIMSEDHFHIKSYYGRPYCHY